MFSYKLQLFIHTIKQTVCPEKNTRENIQRKIRNNVRRLTTCIERKSSSQDLIFIIQQLREKPIRKARDIHICFVDLKKEFNRIRKEDVCKSIERKEVERDLIEINSQSKGL